MGTVCRQQQRSVFHRANLQRAIEKNLDGAKRIVNIIFLIFKVLEAALIGVH